MRLDFTLYGLAAVLFGITTAVFFILKQADYQLVITLSAATLGLICVVGGYLMRPKTQSVQQIEKTVQPQPEPVPTKPIAMETSSSIQETKVEAPINPTPAPAVVTPAKQEEPKMLADRAADEIPVLSAPQSEPQLLPPAEIPVLLGPSVSVDSDLTQIRGINAARAEQLKANGIGSIADLAKASPEELASKLAVSPKIIKMWIGSAKKKTT